MHVPSLEHLFDKRAQFLSVLVLALTVLLPSIVGGVEGGLLELSEKSPVTVEAGQVFTVRVRLRLPLTPPPGVQQSGAKKEWRARLVGRAFTPSNGAARVDYPLDVVRIRPEGEETYRAHLVTRPWILPGTYDLELEGPGLIDRVSGGIRVSGNCGACGRAPVTVEILGEGRFRVVSSGEARWMFDVSVPAGVPGLKAVFDGKRLKPSAISWKEEGGAPKEMRPVLRFEADVGPSPREHILVLLPADSIPCRGRIRGSANVAGRQRLLSRELSFRGHGGHPGLPGAVAWDFGDGKKGAGNPIRHRFLLRKRFEVTAAQADELGRVCLATWELGSQIESAGDCGCRSAGRTDRKKLLRWLVVLH